VKNDMPGNVLDLQKVFTKYRKNSFIEGEKEYRCERYVAFFSK